MRFIPRLLALSILGISLAHADPITLLGAGGIQGAPPILNVQKNFHDGSGTTCSVTLGSTVAANDAVVGYISWPTVQSISSILDDKGNSYPLLGTPKASASFQEQAFLLAGISNSPETITVTFNGSTSFCGIGVDEFSNVSGADTTVPAGGVAGQFLNTASGTNALTSGDLTTFTNGDMLWGTLAGSTNLPSVGTGFTLSNNDTTNGLITEYTSQTSAGAAAAFGTVSSGGGWAFVVPLKPKYRATPANFFSYDGYSSPVIAAPVAYTSSTTGKTWVTWEGTSGPNRNQEVRTIDASGNESSIYSIGTTSLSDDLHGVGAISYHEASGHAYIACCAHNSSAQIAYSTNPNDPSAWTIISMPSGTYGPITFPRPIVYGNNLYIFYNTSGNGSSQQESVAVTVWPINPTTGVPTPSGTRQLLFDAPSAWLLATWGCFVWNGNVVLTWNYGPNVFTPPVENGYLAFYNLSTAAVTNFSGSTSVPQASQPVLLAAMSAFQIYTSTNSQQPIAAIDASGMMHVLVGDETLTNTPILEMHGTPLVGTGLSTAQNIATFTGGTFGPYELTLNNQGGVNAYWIDATFPGTSSYAIGGGNLWQRAISPSGALSSAVETMAATTFPFFGLGFVDPLESLGPSNARVVWGESALDGLTQSGLLRSYVLGDQGSWH